MPTMVERSEQGTSGTSEAVPTQRRGRGRGWLAVGVVVAASAVLVALFLVAMRNNTGAPEATVQPAPAARTVPVTGPVVISLTDFKIGMPTTLAAGQVTLDIRNIGRVAHELLVFKSPLDVSRYPKQASGSLDEEGVGITKVSDGDNLDPAGTQIRTVDLTTPGTYVFVCNLPGHFAAGMYTSVIVK